MKSPTKKNGDIGFFATPEEIATAQALETKFSLITRQQQSLRGDYQDEYLETIQARYVNSPTDENFVAYKTAQIEKQTYLAFAIRKLSVVVESAHDKFVQEELLPFARPILLRNLESARRNLAGVTENENARHIEHFGTPISESALIGQARAAVAELEMLSAAANNNAATSQIEGILARIKSFPVIASAA
jgi:hypothetical protein